MSPTYKFTYIGLFKQMLDDWLTRVLIKGFHWSAILGRLGMPAIFLKSVDHYTQS